MACQGGRGNSKKGLASTFANKDKDEFDIRANMATGLSSNQVNSLESYLKDQPLGEQQALAAYQALYGKKMTSRADNVKFGNDLRRLGYRDLPDYQYALKNPHAELNRIELKSGKANAILTPSGIRTYRAMADNRPPSSAMIKEARQRLVPKGFIEIPSGKRPVSAAQAKLQSARLEKLKATFKRSLSRQKAKAA